MTTKQTSFEEFWREELERNPAIHWDVDYDSALFVWQAALDSIKLPEIKKSRPVADYEFNEGFNSALDLVKKEIARLRGEGV